MALKFAQWTHRSPRANTVFLHLLIVRPCGQLQKKLHIPVILALSISSDETPYCFSCSKHLRLFTCLVCFCACKHADFATRVDARPRPVSLDTKPREITAGSFVVCTCALNRNATGDEQLRLWGQVGLHNGGQWDPFRHAVPASWCKLVGCGEATDTLYVDCVSIS